ncbi:response regulator [Roseospirillum parvum]|uniref:Response regulator receiver domain-containing protein n=1 Tax=Roseospirillum parvum TaxID=83401 RepID=A0A1G8ERI9_9PROT|nr:response regulator [Roseospirillum parvum]SDH72508.1 Response regulator receiver domain-containing protein [Roseospirillum parvum]
MALSYSFANARALVGLCDPQRMQTVRSNLYYLGFRDTIRVDSLEALDATLDSLDPDLLVVDLGCGEAEVARLIRDVRLQRRTASPFVPIIVIAQTASETQVKAMINAGADDVVSIPWPSDYFDRRLDLLVRERRPFVVTSDYVGPERRQHARRGAQSIAFPVPNPLNMKTLDRRKREDIAAETEQAQRQLNDRRIVALAGLIARLLASLQWLYEQNEVDVDHATASLERLALACRETLDRRHPDSRHAEAVVICRAVLDEAERLTFAHARGIPPAVDELPPLLDGVCQAFGLDREHIPVTPPPRPLPPPPADLDQQGC